MNDDLAQAALHRARSAIDLAAGNVVSRAAQRRAFRELAFAMAGTKDLDAASAVLRRSENYLVAKAAASATTDELWTSVDARRLAEAFVASTASGSVFDSIARFAPALPLTVHSVAVASDAVGNIVAEGAPKPVRNLNLTAAPDSIAKAVALVVVTRELLALGGEAAKLIFEAELIRATNRAMNGSVLGLLTPSATTVAGTGNVVTDLQLGLAAADAGAAYIVVATPGVATPGVAAALATSEANRAGAAATGGDLADGVVLVPAAVDYMTIIPVAGLALWDNGLTLRPSGDGDVDMRDTPTSPPQLTSLFQTNSLGLLAERMWRIAGSTAPVIVEAPE